MSARKHLTFILLCILATTAYCQESSTQHVIKGCCTLQARAYVDKSYPPNSSSRFDLEIARTQKNTYDWGFIFDGDSNYLTGNINEVSPVPYGNHKKITIRAILHQYDYYDERVTFKDLDLLQLSMGVNGTSTFANGKNDFYPSFLMLSKPITLTTPSGISVTLPAHGLKDAEKWLRNPSGNANALFIQVEISPNKSEVVLPNSPLYKEHGKPVHIKLGYPDPDPDLIDWHLAKYKTFSINLPNLKNTTHLDSLTLIVRQTVELQALPVSIQVPITR